MRSIVCDKNLLFCLYEVITLPYVYDSKKFTHTKLYVFVILLNWLLIKLNVWGQMVSDYNIGFCPYEVKTFK